MNGKSVYLILMCLGSMLSVSLGASHAMSSSSSARSASSSSVSSSSSAAFASPIAASTSSSSVSSDATTLRKQIPDPNTAFSLTMLNPRAYGKMATQALKESVEPLVKDWYEKAKKEGVVIGETIRYEVNRTTVVTIKPILLGIIGGIAVIGAIILLVRNPDHALSALGLAGVCFLMGQFYLTEGGFFEKGAKADNGTKHQ